MTPTPNPGSDAAIEADLMRLLEGGPIIGLVLSADEIEAAHRLERRGAVRRYYQGAAGLMGVWHVTLPEPPADRAGDG